MHRSSCWRRRLYGLAIVSSTLSAPVAAQQAGTGTVTGTVVDRESKAPIDGARIIVTGTTLETQTNASGEYRLVGLRPGRFQLGVLRIGFTASSDTVTITANGTATVNFQLQRTVTTLQELVVTGTLGNQERRAQAATVTSISASDIKQNAAISSVNEMLQSRAAGVSVGSASGTPGTSRSIRIRGPASVSLSNQPIVFIDGIRFQEGNPSLNAGGQIADRLNDLNPDDIESIEVLKGPAAATMYGADASSGVIQIITKRGRAGANTFQQSLRAEYGQVDANFDPPSNFGACTAALVAPTSTNPLCRGQAVGTLVSDNPLERQNVIRDGSDLLLGWTGRGGGQNYGYFLSAGADRNIGVLPNSDFRRYSFRSNFNFIPTSKITVDAGFQALQSDLDAPDNDNNIFGYLGGALLGQPQTRRDDGVPASNGWFGFNRDAGAIAGIQNNYLTRRTLFNTTATYLPNSWLKNRITIGADLLNDQRTRFFPKNTGGFYGGALDGGSNAQARIGNQRYTFDYLADANRKFGAESQVDVNLSLGFQAIASRTDSVTALGEGFAVNAANSVGLAAVRVGAGGQTEVRQYGYLGQLQVGFRDRIFVQAGARLDDFSAFGVATDPIFLPKIGASWVVSDEGWFPQSQLLTSFRLRGAFGTTGRAPTPGAALTTLDAAAYNITGITQSGAVPRNPGNDSLLPEKGTELEVGFDASMFRDRVNVELNFFRKVSQDLLLRRPLPGSLGFSENPFVNLGEVLNQGLEVSVNGQMLRRRNFEWESRVNFNTLRNELTDLGGVLPFGTLNRFTEGYQVGSFVSKQIRNINEQTGVVTVADTFEVVGNLWPTFEGAWSNTFTLFRNFRITALVDTKQDFYVHNNTHFFRETQLVRSDNRLDPNKLPARERLRRYGNPTAGQPAFRQENGAATTVNETRDAYIQPGDFVRFRELAATFTLPRNLMSRFGSSVSNASIGLAFQNLALWTDYEGFDPEVISAAGAEFSRGDFLTLPNPRRAILRFNVAF